MPDKNLQISDLLDCYGEMLTEKQRDVIDLYYNQDLSLAEIAEHEGISRQGVRDNIKRGETFLLELEEKLQVSVKFKKLLALSEQVGQLCVGIQEANRGRITSLEIEENATRIRELMADYVNENI